MRDKVKRDLDDYLNNRMDKNSFKSLLYQLIIKSDLSNRRLLSKGFPDEVQAVNEYTGVTEKKDV